MIKPIKTSIVINGSCEDRIKKIQKYVRIIYGRRVSRSEIVNIAINEFLKSMENIEDIDIYLVKYNRL